MNYKLVLISLVYLNSYASQDAATLPIEKPKSFLLAYGGLPEIPLPRDVQYLITQNVLDEMLLPFSFEEPQVTYDLEVSHTSAPQLTFSEDDSQVAFISRSNPNSVCVIVPTKPNNESKIHQLTTQHYLFGGCCFNKDGTKLFASQACGFDGSRLLVFDLLTDTVQEIQGIQEILDEAPRVTEEQLDHLTPYRNRIHAISRTPQGDIVFCSSSKEVFILDDQNSRIRKLLNTHTAVQLLKSKGTKPKVYYINEFGK